MAKYTGSYESLIRGVSEQVPQDRYVGQHWAQDNMVADPVRGLARRHGSKMITEKAATGVTFSSATKTDISGWKEYTFFINSVEYSIMYRSQAKTVGSTGKGLLCLNKDTGAILDLLVPVSEQTALQTLLDGGISAITKIGKYVCIAPQSSNPTYTQADQVDLQKRYSIVWIKQGAYSRTYTLTVVRSNNTRVSSSYTTPASYYNGVLDTSGVPASATDYVKQVNDIVNTYQSNVNRWIASAASAIQPQAIASSLKAQWNADHPTLTPLVDTGSHILANSTDYINIVVDDGGDGTYAKAIGQEVETVADLSPQHVVGKVVRIRPRQGTSDGVYYVKATSSDGSLPTGSFGPVTWRETAGIAITPGFVFMVGQIIDSTMYLALTPETLATLSGDSLVNKYVPSAAGDLDSSPLPGWFGKRIDHLTAFQDRLMIVSGSTIFLSKSGDYFNWFRQSALTVQDDDPVEVYALGSDGNTISDSVMLDRSLILFGKQQQYAMDGRAVLTPRTAFVATQSAHEDSNLCPPVVSGNFIFFTQKRNSRLTVQQMQTGDYADSFRAFDITTQLDGYISGTPRQIVAMTSPSTLAIRVSEWSNGFYIFHYLDSSDQTERLYDSWSRWYSDPSLGCLIGITNNNGNIMAVWLRDNSDGTCKYVVDQYYREANYAKRPYIDSYRPYTNLTGTVRPSWVGASVSVAAYDETAANTLALVGDTLANAASVSALGGGDSSLLLGVLYDSYVEPTAPYIRDSKDKAILDGRLTLSGMKITVAQTSAMRAYLRGNTDAAPGDLITDWIYREAGVWTLNTQQVAMSATISVHVLREIREFRLRLSARNWLPFTLSSIEWSGQFFTQRRR